MAIGDVGEFMRGSPHPLQTQWIIFLNNYQRAYYLQISHSECMPLGDGMLVCMFYQACLHGTFRSFVGRTVFPFSLHGHQWKQPSPMEHFFSFSFFN